MAFAFRPVRTDPVTGEKTRVRKWYARYKDPATGRWVTRAGYRDRKATKAMAERLEREAARRHEGLPVADPEAGRPIGEWIDAYAAHMAAKGDSSRHVAETKQQVADLIAGCGWTTVRAVNADDATAWLATRRRQRRFGVRTSNKYLTALKGFTRWLTRRRVLPADPLAYASRVSGLADRHVRRVLTPDEFDRLLTATRSAPRYQSLLTGPERALLYWTAAYTGLRASELASLIPSSLHLDADPPTVTVAAVSEKARRGAVLPLQNDLADALRDYIVGRPKGLPLWPGRWAADLHGAKMLRRDLKLAGIPYRTDAGVFDFHALRSYYVVSLATAGVPLTVVQKLARHATPMQTASAYARHGLEELKAAVDRLPPRVHGDVRAHGRQRRSTRGTSGQAAG